MTWTLSKTSVVTKPSLFDGLRKFPEKGRNRFVFHGEKALKSNIQDCEKKMSSRSVVKRFAPYVSARIRENHRMLNYCSSAASALKEASSSSSSSSSSSPSLEAVHLSDNCIRRMKELQSSEPEKKLLRLGVETGGCSGFQYVFELDHKTNPDDRVFEKDGVKLVVDNVSYDFVKGATVDYVEELIRSAFVVAENPAAVGGCSCKSSFMVKQ